jgi:hypothetical protein
MNHSYSGGLSISSFFVTVNHIPGLVRHLDTQIPHLAPFYKVLVERRKRDEPLSDLDIAIANGTRSVSEPEVARYLADIVPHGDFKVISLPLCHSTSAHTFQEPFSYEKWEEKLINYIIVSNLPFSEVDVEEFADLIHYTHHNLTNLNIPSSSTVKRRVLKASEHTVDQLRSLFRVSSLCVYSIRISVDVLILLQDHTGKIALILDAWTSSNGHAFLAIVARFVNKDFELGLQDLLT